MDRPLEGLRVLDLSRVLAGPFCSMLMGDMGAQVIKVEEPGLGDDTRRFGPPFVHGESAYFLSANRNKRSLALNMKAPEAAPVLRRLIEQADVLLENFRPGTASRLGLGWDQVHAINPRLVYVSVSGYGQTGPEAGRPGYDVVIQGVGGIMSLTGEPSGTPYKMGISQADLVAGLNAFSGVLLALRVRDRTGVGQHVDISLLDCQVALLTFQAQTYLTTGVVPQRRGNQHPSIAPYETVAVEDGYLNLAVGNDKLWQGFCAAVERPDLATDERFVTNPLRVANHGALMAELSPLFKSHPVAWWMQVLDGAGIPAGPILSIDQVLDQPQVKARDMVVEVDHPTVGPLRLVSNSIKLSATPASIQSPPPLLGQHSREVLLELGIDDGEIDDWLARGVIGTPAQLKS